jgi:hypothetical protein
MKLFVFFSWLVCKYLHSDDCLRIHQEDCCILRFQYRCYMNKESPSAPWKSGKCMSGANKVYIWVQIWILNLKERTKKKKKDLWKDISSPSLSPLRCMLQNWQEIKGPWSRIRGSELSVFFHSPLSSRAVSFMLCFNLSEFYVSLK